ncbi:MAG: hypothetical protein HFJ40_06025 [Clostridia bacterium]|nr:hypothetical protein [Clostridia bacterium]
MNLKEYLPIIISGFAPILVVIINSIYQYYINKQNNEIQIKLKEFDYIHKEKTQAVNKYIENFYNYINNRNEDNLTKFKMSSYKVLLYVSGYSRQCVTNLIGVIDSFDDVSNREYENQLQSFLDSLNNETSINKM